MLGVSTRHGRLLPVSFRSTSSISETPAVAAAPTLPVHPLTHSPFCTVCTVASTWVCIIAAKVSAWLRRSWTVHTSFPPSRNAAAKRMQSGVLLHLSVSHGLFESAPEHGFVSVVAATFPGLPMRVQA
jgi:hypothetical protein